MKDSCMEAYSFHTGDNHLRELMKNIIFDDITIFSRHCKCLNGVSLRLVCLIHLHYTLALASNVCFQQTVLYILLIWLQVPKCHR